MAMRMYEYKIHVKVVRDTRAVAGHRHDDGQPTSASRRGCSISTSTRRKQYPVGHRMNAWLASMAAEMKAHAATFKKYPPKDIGLGQ